MPESEKKSQSENKHTEPSHPFYSKGLNFTCQRCSSCCGKAPGFVYLSKRDLTELKNYFHLSTENFVKTYCRWANYYGGSTVLALIEKKNYDCILWKEGCTAYPARPIQCETYPFWTWMTDSKESWEECAKACPGMNRGQHWESEHIESERKRYSENEPVTKEEVEEIIQKEREK